MVINKVIGLVNQIRWKIFSVNLGVVGYNCYVGRGFSFHQAKNIKIGNRFNAGENLRLQTWEFYHGEKTGMIPKLTIGNDVSVMSNVQISCMGKITIGNGVLLGDNVLITDNFHGISGNINERHIPPIKRKLFYKGEIVIEDNVWIGRNVCIMGNVYIGTGAIIGANAVVTHDIPSYGVAVGVPAKVIDNNNIIS